MPAQREIKEQVSLESERRNRLGVPAAAGGVLFLLSAIIVNAVISALPSVGVIQGLGPALRGEPNPAVSARAAEVKFLSHHAFGLIAGSVLAALAVIALMLVLLLVFDATRFRNPGASSLPRTLVIVGGAGLAILGIAVQIIRGIRTHDFAMGHNFTEHAVEQALTKGAVNVVIGYLGLLAPLVLAVGMIMVLLAATRVGLITRWLRGLGIAAAIVILPLFAGIFYLQLIPAAWLVAMGFMFMGRLPSGDPPAWEAGEALPWPSQAELRAEAQEARASKRGRPEGASSEDAKSKKLGPEAEAEAEPTEVPSQDSSPEPAQPPSGSQHTRRRRKRR